MLLLRLLPDYQPRQQQQQLPQLFAAQVEIHSFPLISWHPEGGANDLGHFDWMMGPFFSSPSGWNIESMVSNMAEANQAV